MVDPEGRVGGRREEITTRVAANDVVDTAVRTDLNGVGDTLREVAVLIDVGLEEQVQDGGVVGVAHVHGRADISLQAAGVVAETAKRSGRHTLETADGAKVDRHIGEGTSGDIATAKAGGKLDVTTADAGRRDDDGTVVGHVLAVAAQAVVITVEEGRLLGRRGVLGPVPVGLVAGVAALVTEGLLVLVDEPAVPGHEVAGVVDRHGLLDVGDDEVVEPGLGAGGDISRGASGQALEALDGVDVSETLVPGERATVFTVSKLF